METFLSPVRIMISNIKFIGIFLLLATQTVMADKPEINIEGLNKDQEKNVQAYLSLNQENCQSPVWRIKNQFAKSDKEIGKALRPFGYYQPKITKNLSFEKGCWEANFNIFSGLPVLVSHLLVQVNGGDDTASTFQKLLGSLPIKQGDILNHALYEKIKQDLHSLALEKGFLNHHFIKKSLRVFPDKHQANIDIIMDAGPRHHFGDITINQDILDPNFIQRYVFINKNDPYSSKQLAKTYNSLSSSIYFKNVEVTPQLDNIENNEVPVQIKLLPKKAHDISFGLGFDTDIGPLGSVGYQNHRLNHRGHHFSLDLDASPVLSSIETQYMIPFADPRDDFISIGLGYKFEKPETFESHEVKFSLQYHHLYSSGLKQNLAFDISYEASTIGGEDQNTLLIVPNVHWQYSQSNHPLRATQGYRLDFSIASDPETFISDVTFIQATVAGKLVLPLPWSARVIARTKLGATAVSDFASLPASYRYFAGGVETLRGYDYKELGPVNDKDDIVGGKLLSVVSAEYEHFITDTWGAAVFIDAGNAYNTDSFKIMKGVGLGVRWVSPIGPLKIDFAIPLNDSDSSFQIHFAAGSLL